MKGDTLYEDAKVKASDSEQGVRWLEAQIQSGEQLGVAHPGALQAKDTVDTPKKAASF